MPEYGAKRRQNGLLLLVKALLEYPIITIHKILGTLMGNVLKMWQMHPFL